MGEYTYLDPKRVLDEGKLIFQADYRLCEGYGKILKDMPDVDEKSRLVGFLLSFTGPGAVAIALDDDKAYSDFKESFCRTWLAGGIGRIYSLPQTSFEQMVVNKDQAILRINPGDLPEQEPEITFH